MTIGDWVTDARPDKRREARRGLVKLVEGEFAWVYWPDAQKIVRMRVARLRPSPVEGGAS
jgi:hypothetical protein